MDRWMKAEEGEWWIEYGWTVAGNTHGINGWLAD